MGAKTGYADVILRCVGLRPGQGAEHYLWCEPDAGVRLLLHAYRDRELATAAADIIRGWKDEPRALWERLRAEGPAVCPPVDPREVARWMGSHALTAMSGGYDSAAERAARGERWGGDVRVFVPNRLEIVGAIPATIADDARKVDPREVARVARIISANRLVNPDPETWQNTGNGGYKHGGPEFCTPIGRLADAMAAGPQVDGAAVVDDARKVDPPRFPPGVVAYIDPPYLNTTGYAHLFPRAEWLPVVRRWAEAGALVVVSEAEPIPDLMAEGWHSVRIDGERKGQKRTFSKQQAEWLTMSEPPRWRPSVQASLFD